MSCSAKTKENGDKKLRKSQKTSIIRNWRNFIVSVSRISKLTRFIGVYRLVPLESAVARVRFCGTRLFLSQWQHNELWGVGRLTPDILD